MTDWEKRVVHTLSGEGVEPGRFMFFCPGCECGHWFQTGTGSGPRWTFNGDMEKPTVSPSILTRHTQLVGECKWCDADLPWKQIEIGRVHEDPSAGPCGYRGCGKAPVDFVCHSYVRDGQIQFLGDCTHKLAGQTVPLEPF